MRPTIKDGIFHPNRIPAPPVRPMVTRIPVKTIITPDKKERKNTSGNNRIVFS